ncbi:hypothetical protein BBF96_15505 [Anoxybacter fermentans]|uniref:DUF2520 domain-containing protein n=1 Tax=Anoxybacter fermentans TaxID=1323375 RepID=A0A3Q9HSA8_9FIRM|nr:Rossmann-like and DUF2520 domain-containing protein [Anoxybacter fermentans]AZR74654.1 hypothetical protein BBF96_15505 [Anoxybacter fermentans]
MARKSFALIGPGRVGTALSYLLQERGYILRTVVGRSDKSLNRAKLFLRGEITFTKDLAELPNDLNFIILGVKDDGIEEVVHSLWYKNLLKTQQVLIHLSGVLPSDVGQLSEMPEIGRLSLHPLQAVADVETGIGKLTQSVWSMEGNDKGIILGEELLGVLSVRWLKISKEQKPLYHAAACVVSNYLVTLMQQGIEMLKKVGFSPELAQEALFPLIEGTVLNLKEKPPCEALTGPIARGDSYTIAKHIQAISKVNHQWLELYRILGSATLQYAPLSENEVKLLSKIFSGEEYQ